MKEHVLKIRPEPFADLESGAKTGEVRPDDRDFQVGDTVRLRELRHSAEVDKLGTEYTGRERVRTISHIQRGYGLPAGLCVLSYEPVVRVAFVESFKMVRSPAPWPDFAGKPIHVGDTIRHPSGETGVVVYMPDRVEPFDRWRVRYQGSEATSALGLQVGDKGQAVVVAPQVLVGELGTFSDPLRIIPACRTCGGSGMVSDGAITHSEGGIPYENGPVECVRDCPTCKPANPPQDRAGFEAAMRTALLAEGYSAMDLPSMLERNRQGDYSAIRVRGAYQGWQLARQAMGVPILVEAVATLRQNPDDEFYLDWLLEGGIAALEIPGTTLLVAQGTLTDDEGSGYVYAAPGEPA